MECSVVVVGQFGIPFDNIVARIDQKYSVGKCLNPPDQPVVQGALHTKIVEGFSFARKKQYDISVLVVGYTWLEFLIALDAVHSDLKVVYCQANSYWRCRQAANWNVLIDDFLQNEELKATEEVFKARADAILDFDKVIGPTSSLILPNIDSMLAKTLAKLDIHSSKVRI